jgi:hypothetical protein
VTGGDPGRPLTSSTRTLTALTLAILVACGALYALVARIAFHGFPYSGDEYSLALQADLFARGLLKAPAPEHAQWFRVDHVVIDRWVRSKYPPGAAALLSLGARAGGAWIVTPIEGVVALAVVWLTTRRLLGARPALVALLVVGLAPLFAFQAATFYPQTATTMFLAVAFAGIAGWSQGQRSGWLVLVGAALGCAFLTRPIDALLFAVAMLSLRSPRALLVTGASALPFVALNLAYQKAQFGSPLTDGYHAYEPTFAALYGATAASSPILLSRLWSPVQQWNHLDLYRAFIVDWTVPGTALVALLGAFSIDRDHRARPLRNFSVAFIATYVLALLPMIADVDDGARPRYLSSALIPVAFLSAAGFSPASAALASRFGRRLRTALVVIAIVFAPAQLAAFLVTRVPLVWKREGLYRAVEQAGVRDGLVVVRAKYPSRYARNGGLFDGAVLYLSPPPTTSGATIAAAFPGRAIWEAREGEPWTLTRTR